jgi:hypothetical protein
MGGNHQHIVVGSKRATTSRRGAQAGRERMASHPLLTLLLQAGPGLSRSFACAKFSHPHMIGPPCNISFGPLGTQQLSFRVLRSIPRRTKGNSCFNIGPLQKSTNLAKNVRAHGTASQAFHRARGEIPNDGTIYAVQRHQLQSRYSYNSDSEDRDGRLGVDACSN